MTPTENNNSGTKTVGIVFRKEQMEAIDYTARCLQHSRKMLWNAKMRFGKTLCALEVAHRQGYHKTLILTHRPTVRHEWFDALERLGYKGWLYGCKKSSLQRSSAGLDIHSFEELDNMASAHKDTHFIYFASMQDLRSSKRINPTKGTDKNEAIFSTKWDLLIVDEAHEGILTKLGQDVIGELQKKRAMRTLYLSGTPYNLQSLFDSPEVYRWDYTMEQESKTQWAATHPDEANPYEGLARMNILTYSLNKYFKKFSTGETGHFNYAEFFSVEDVATADGDTQPKFVHEKQVREWLHLIGKKSNNSEFPFASDSLTDSMRHSLWYVTGIKAAAALAQLLREQSADNPFSDYTIVNVAGNSERLDPTESARKEKDALERVRDAIANNSKTITLTCGRLIMGVSVPEWTAVLMLAGSEAGSARYFQAIFRAQSPYVDGRIKHECYAIDFSPARTLAAIDQYIANNISGTSQAERLEKLDKFLTLSNVVLIGTRRKTRYNAERFIHDINVSYSENLMRDGFRSDCLYRGLDNLRKQDIKLLDQIADAIAQGITAERQQIRDAISTTKPRKPRSAKPATTKTATKTGDAPHAARLTPRQRAIAILNQISTRFPMMIYGMVEKIDGLTLDAFINQIDAESWEEFMPKGITMKMFQKIRHFYREDIFVATAKAIVDRLHKADDLPIGERVTEIASILSDFCYPDRETVLTPWRTVNKQLSDTLGGQCFYNETFDKTLASPRFVYREGITDKVFMKPTTRILDMSSKTGLYSLYAAYSIYQLRSSQSQGLFDMLSDDEQNALWTKIVEQNIFALCKTKMAKLITQRTLVGYRDIKPNIRVMNDLVTEAVVYKRRFIRTVSDGKEFWHINNEDKMKFDAIICNPPYQVNIGEQKDNYGIPLYNHFVDVARSMQPNFISMIMPSRWFTGGRGLDAFRQSMLSDKHLAVICDYVDSRDCFPTVDISGGIGYFLWDAHHKGDCEFTNTLHGKSCTKDRRLDEFPIFVRNNNALTVINKAIGSSKTMLSSQVSGQTPFGFVTTYRGKATASTDGSTCLLKSSGATTYVDRQDVKKNAEWIDLYKVIFSKATCEHAGTPDKNGQFRVLSSAAILAPGAICTQSYLVGGAYGSEQEATGLLKYLKTKFVRYLMLQTITSQDLSPEKFMFVPMQDFSNTSDIDWSADLEAIDQQLYKKYDISTDEIKIIDGVIKPM